MTRHDLMLVKLMEECCEVAHVCSKALRFGVNEVYPGKPELGTNGERIMGEYADVFAIIEMLGEEDILSIPDEFLSTVDERKARVEEYLRYSAECGRLEEDKPTPVELNLNLAMVEEELIGPAKVQSLD